MSNFILTIIFALGLTSAINAYGVGGYGNYGNFGDYSQYYPFQGGAAGAGSATGAAGDTKNPQNTACANSLANADRAFSQLVKDLKDNVPQWILIQSLDAVNEVSYFIKNSCKTALLELRNTGAIGLNATQDEACSKLAVTLEDLLEENQASSFRGGFEASIDTALEVQKIAPSLGDNCKLQLAVKEEALTNTQDQVNVPSTQASGQSLVGKFISKLFSVNPLLHRVHRRQAKVHHAAHTGEEFLGLAHRHHHKSNLNSEEKLVLCGEDNDLFMSHHTRASSGETDLIFNHEDLLFSHHHHHAAEATLMCNHEDDLLFSHHHHHDLESSLMFNHEDDLLFSHHHHDLESTLMCNHEDDLFFGHHHHAAEDDLFFGHHHHGAEDDLFFSHHHHAAEATLMFNHEDDLFFNHHHHSTDNGEFVLDLYTVNKNGDTDSGSQWMGGDYQRYNDPTFWQNGGYNRYYNGNGQPMYGVPASLTTPTANATLIKA